MGQGQHSNVGTVADQAELEDTYDYDRQQPEYDQEIRKILTDEQFERCLTLRSLFASRFLHTYM